LRWLFAGLWLWCFSQISFATEPRFGPEHTFTNQELFESFPPKRAVISTDVSDRYLRQYYEKISEIQASGERSFKISSSSRTFGFSSAEKYRITFQDGFSIDVFSDPGVIEVTHDPVTIADYESKYQKRVQTLVFDVLKQMGLTPWEFAGSGHIHLDLESSFGSKGRILRQYVADYYNHPVLAGGAFNHDIRNSAGLFDLPESVRAGFQVALKAFDDSRDQSPEEFRRLFRKMVANNNTSPDPVWNRRNTSWKARPDKYHALHFSHFDTLEHRSFRPQSSAQEFLDQIKIIANRIEMLSKVEQSIGFDDAPLPKTAQKRAQQFFDYARPSKIPWKRLAQMSVPQWRDSQEYMNYQVNSPAPKFRTAADLTPCEYMKLIRQAGIQP
jgi:hypothetical protein